MKTTKMLVTPALAAEWLEKNTRNRPLQQSAVVALANEIKAGRWVLTHQGIARSEDGTLLDGQHRLHAVLAANIAVEMLVSTGARPETMLAIDIGGCGVRRPHHVLAIAEGIQSSTVLRATVMAAQRLVEGKPLSGGKTRITVNDLRFAIAEHHDHAVSVIEAIGAAHNRLCQAPVNGALTVLHRVFQAEVLTFASLVRNGAGLEARHPALALRNYLLLDYNPDGRSSRDNLADRTFSAFDAYQRKASRRFVRPNVSAREAVIARWQELKDSGAEP